jgi:GTP-binding protein
LPKVQKNEKKKDKDKAETRISSAEFAAAAAESKQIPAEGEGAPPEIAFAGRSNVGKSSLLNMLLARKGLARTSNTPGRTREIVFFDVKVASGPALKFVDLPGYGYAKVSKSQSHSWKGLIESYLKDRAALRAIIILVDIRRGIEEEERDLLEFLAQRKDLTVVVVATKLDKLALNAQKPALAAMRKESGVQVIGTSAETKVGREDVWSRILHHVK